METQVDQVGNENIRGCIACLSCKQKGKCVFDDLVNQIAPQLEAADGLVIASPVYYASANGGLISFLDRLFYSTLFDKTMKVGAAVAVARRGGNSATYDELNKYFAISGMPIATGRGPANHAYSGPEHGLFDEVHRLGQGALRPARARTLPADQLHSLRPSPSSGGNPVRTLGESRRPAPEETAPRGTTDPAQRLRQRWRETALGSRSGGRSRSGCLWKAPAAAPAFPAFP